VFPVILADRSPDRCSPERLVSTVLSVSILAVGQPLDTLDAVGVRVVFVVANAEKTGEPEGVARRVGRRGLDRLVAHLEDDGGVDIQGSAVLAADMGFEQVGEFRQFLVGGASPDPGDGRITDRETDIEFRRVVSQKDLPGRIELYSSAR
jgi:hypothetical protein